MYFLKHLMDVLVLKYKNFPHMQILIHRGAWTPTIAACAPMCLSLLFTIFLPISLSLSPSICSHVPFSVLGRCTGKP